MIVDFHTHIFDPHIIKNREEYFNDRIFSLLYSGERSRIIDCNGILEAMNKNRIDYAVAMGFPWETGKYCEKQNIYLKDSMTSSGGRIIPFGSLPVEDKGHIEDWVSGIKELGLAGIGEIAFYSEGLDSSNIFLLGRIFEAACKFAMPVCLHLDEPVGHHHAGKHRTDLAAIYSLLQDFPDLIVIFAHWGGGLIFYELMKEVQALLKNVYYDTAASPYLYKDDIYRIAIDIAGSEKILFGSDFPLIDFSRYLDSINRNVKDSKDKENILGENAGRILQSFIKNSQV